MGRVFFGLIPEGADDALDDIGLAFLYSRREVLAMPLPAILRLRARALRHLALLYGRGIIERRDDRRDDPAAGRSGHRAAAGRDQRSRKARKGGEGSRRWSIARQGVRLVRTAAGHKESPLRGRGLRDQLKSLDNTFSSLAASAAGFFAAHAGAKLFREEAAAGEEGLKNLLSMKTGGYSDEEIGGAQRKARETSSKYPQFSRSQIEDQIVETTQALGSISTPKG